jgi:hypothetical protein
MALTSKSLFLYGFTVDAYNANLTFNIGGSDLIGTIPYGYYSLETLCQAVMTALSSLAPSRLFSYSIDRTVSGGTQNRVTFTCNTGIFQLNFLVPSSIGPTLGFLSLNYTGSLSYTSNLSAGTTLVPELVGYTYLGPDFYKDINGSVNISATGLKEAVVFQIMQFIQVEFKYEPQAKTIIQWSPFWNWAIQQKVFEFTPQVSDPTTYYEVTLEKSSTNGKGLGFKMTEMLPNFPFYYQTGLITMRRQINPTFITG